MFLLSYDEDRAGDAHDEAARTGDTRRIRTELILPHSRASI